MKKYKNLIENIQRRATKLIPHIGRLSYSDRLKILNLPTLECRRRHGRIIEVFEIVKGLYDPAVSEDFSRLNERDT